MDLNSEKLCIKWTDFDSNLKSSYSSLRHAKDFTDVIIMDDDFKNKWLERVQKSALRVILGKSYTSLNDALKELNIASLHDKREFLCLKMFPRKFTLHEMSKRNFEYFKVNKTLTNWYLNSAIPQMQRMLNIDKEKEIKTLHQLDMPVNNDYCKSVSLRK